MIQTNILPERRDEIKEIVYKTLHHYGEYTIPVKIKDLVHSFSNIRLISYSKHMKKFNLSYDAVVAFTGTRDACTDYYYNDDLYIIYYNDIDHTIYYSNRYRWNIAHELGHIMLDHHKNHEKTRIFRSELSAFEYNALEEEADYFASLILVPHAALLGFHINSLYNIKNMCKISEPAAKRRFRAFTEWKSHVNKDDSYDNRIFHLYYEFIYKRKCRSCTAGLIQRNGKYCPICGKKNTLEWGDGDKMKYPMLDTYENGKLKECPVCGNEDTDINGNYCHICGTEIVNYCSAPYDCSGSGVLPSNARFCPICGRTSTFFELNILKAWNYKAESESEELNTFQTAIDEFDKLPFN